MIKQIRRTLVYMALYALTHLLRYLCSSLRRRGATRIVPNSQFAGTGQKCPPEAGIAAEMKKGSVLIYTGKIYLGPGDNKTNAVRQALNLT